MPWHFPAADGTEQKQDEGVGVRSEAKVQVTEDIREWDYGEYEGLTSHQVRFVISFWVIDGRAQRGGGVGCGGGGGGIGRGESIDRHSGGGGGDIPQEKGKPQSGAEKGQASTST